MDKNKCPIFEFGGILGLKNPCFLGLTAFWFENKIFLQNCCYHNFFDIFKKRI
jgi:hypothetical protein